VGSGLGVRGYMRSPTFTLVNEYDLDDDAKLLHLDGYRLGETLAEAMLEAETFGLEHLFDDEDAIIVIEWAERVATVLPEDRLEVSIAYLDHPHERRFTLRAHGPRSRAILQQLKL
jgi:tRNA threonylcarbamoyladenosine biosynthesis protein TsaE